MITHDNPWRNNPPAVELINPHARQPLLLIADHAGCAVPRDLHDAVGPLGLPPTRFDQHIAWDIGAAGVARRLAAALQATAVLANYSRLIIDPNRPLGDEESIPRNSDGTSVPLNQTLTEREIALRAEQFFWPYHRAIEEQLARLKRSAGVPLLLSIHSFTPALRVGGAYRPWHVSVMASRDRRFADVLMAALAAQGHTVAFNKPYSGITHGYCIKVHGFAQGLPHAQLEIRQDLVGAAAGQAEWADSLATILPGVIANRTLRSIEY